MPPECDKLFHAQSDRNDSLHEVFLETELGQTFPGYPQKVQATSGSAMSGLSFGLSSFV